MLNRHHRRGAIGVAACVAIALLASCAPTSTPGLSSSSTAAAASTSTSVGPTADAASAEAQTSASSGAAETGEPGFPGQSPTGAAETGEPGFPGQSPTGDAPTSSPLPTDPAVFAPELARRFAQASGHCAPDQLEVVSESQRIYQCGPARLAAGYGNFPGLRPPSADEAVLEASSEQQLWSAAVPVKVGERASRHLGIDPSISWFDGLGGPTSFEVTVTGTRLAPGEGIDASSADLYEGAFPLAMGFAPESAALPSCNTSPLDGEFTVRRGAMFKVDDDAVYVAFTEDLADPAAQKTEIEALAGEFRQACGVADVDAVRSGGWVLVAPGGEGMQKAAQAKKAEYIDLPAG